jgi:transglutaminase-like putative cysteine protease
MQRRDFLRLTGLASAGLVLPQAIHAALAQSGPDRWRIYEVTKRVEVLKPAGTTRVWLPTPLVSDTRYQKSLGNAIDAHGGSSGFTTDARYGAGIAWAEWPEGTRPAFTLTSRFATRDIAVDLARPGQARAEERAVLAKYLAPTDLMPTDGIVKQTSSSIVKAAGARTEIEKARAIYEWVVDTTFRDPKTRGCGVGDVRFMLENNALGGKCADLNALFVALARAEGIPARDVYGIRVADSALGYRSLGKSGDITKAQHCRAEFYSAGHGWVPVDPADVRKVILEEGGGKAKDDPMVVAARQRLFGSWEMNWLGYNYAHDVSLPKASGGKLGFFMYPQCETAEGRLDCLDPENFRYQIAAREIQA